jgi:hypothetical protein
VIYLPYMYHQGSIALYYVPTSIKKDRVIVMTMMKILFKCILILLDQSGDYGDSIGANADYNTKQTLDVLPRHYPARPSNI